MNTPITSSDDLSKLESPETGSRHSAEGIPADAGFGETLESVTAAAEAAENESEEEPSSAPVDAIDTDLVMAIDALGMTWSAFQLYPEPAETPAWLRAMDLFAMSQAYPVFVQVAPDSFMSESGMVEASVEGANRIVRALFLHEVSAISLPAPPASDDLVRFFEILGDEPDAVLAAGGIRALLTNAGISSVEVVSRGPLEESTNRMDAGRDNEVKEIVGGELDPRAIAERVTADAGGDVEVATERFTMWYEDVLGKVDGSDFAGRESVVMTFSEVFFQFEPELRLAIIEFCLASRTKPAFQFLLDQFSGHELAAMAHDLSPGSQGELSDYARTSMDEGRPGELVGMLQSASEVDEARKAVAGRIAELLDDGEVAAGRGATFARLRAEVAGLPPASGMGKRVLRDLLAIENRDARFRRLLRIWTGKVARGIHVGDLEDAEEWLDVGLTHRSYAEGREDEVLEALAAMATDDVITALVSHYGEGELPSLTTRLIDAWGIRVTRRLVDRLAGEEEPTRRRALIDLLAAVSSDDASGIFASLGDSRWFLVRNLATALGKTGRPDAAPRLRQLAATHDDYRVRVEALRSLMPISMKQGLAAAIKGLRDEHKRVRQASVLLLAAAEGPEVDDALLGALANKEVSTEAKLRVIGVLGDRNTPAARAALDQLAKKRSLVGAARTLRAAAAEALKGGDG